jgi:RND family efflux transporter MFP subunit
MFGPASVTVIHPYYGPAVQAVYATGTVEPEVMLPIASRITARIAKLNVDEGMDVEKGDILAQLENEDVRAALESLQAKERFARSQFERNQVLRDRTAISQQEFEKSRSDWESAKAAAAQAAAEMGFLTLMAPATGRVIRRDGEIGQLIPANQPVFWIQASSDLRITAEVDEEDISLVKVEQPVLIRADAFPNQIFHGEVHQITPKGDPVARSYRVRISFTEPNPLRIGMTAETNIVVRKKDRALLVPSSAVERDQVWVVENSRLARREVATGVQGESSSEIERGLTESDLVVASPNEELKAGQRVRSTLLPPPQ